MNKLIKALDVAMEKTTLEVSKIQQQMSKIEKKNNSFDTVMQYFHYYMNKDANYKRDVLDKNDDMMLDKENYKRNCHGSLRDATGHKQHLLCDNDNIDLGGNHNNCNISETDSIGNCHP
jgi:uncharacterized protein YycO